MYLGAPTHSRLPLRSLRSMVIGHKGPPDTPSDFKKNSGFNAYSILPILGVLTGTIFIHELGHYVAARLMGVPAKLRFDHVKTLGEVSPMQQVIISAAGPAINLGAAACFVGLSHFLGENSDYASLITWATRTNLGAGILNLFPLTPNFDGHKVIQSLKRLKNIATAGKKQEVEFYSQNKKHQIPSQNYDDLEDQLQRLVGSESDVEKIRLQTRRVLDLESRFDSLSQKELSAKTIEFRNRLKKGEVLDRILPEAFAVVREATARVLGKKQYVEQIFAAVVLNEGRIVEQKTGEGKTLSLLLSVYLNALQGPVDVYTFNDYLALRDAEEVGPVLHFLGLSVAALDKYREAFFFTPQTGVETHEQYPNLCKASKALVMQKADVIYGTNKSFIFAQLWDHEEDEQQKFVTFHREKACAFIDEADAELLEEANSDYRIVSSDWKELECYEFLYKFVSNWSEGEYFSYQAKTESVILTPKALTLLQSLKRNHPYLSRIRHLELYVKVALKAAHYMHNNKDYIVIKDEVIVVDRYTGRLMYGRTWGNGLHRFIEIKEGLSTKSDYKLATHMAVSHFMSQYRKLSGITGTVGQSAEEFASIYNLSIVEIPPHRPSRRTNLPRKLYKSYYKKIQGIIEEIVEISKSNTGRPILIGCRDIEETLLIAAELRKLKLRFNLLNGVQKSGEKQMIADAGQKGMITLSTQLSGRGTDIIPHPEVLALGGLHVIDTSINPSQRVDHQIRGRSGRQGQVGTSRQFISLDEPLILAFAEKDEQEKLSQYLTQEAQEIIDPEIDRLLRVIQKRAENHDKLTRQNTLKNDKILGPLRQFYFDLRESVLKSRALPNSTQGFAIPYHVILSRLPFQRKYLLKMMKKHWHNFLAEYEEICREDDGPTSEKASIEFHKIFVKPFLNEASLFLKIRGGIAEGLQSLASYFEDTVFNRMTEMFRNNLSYPTISKLQTRYAKFYNKRKKYQKALKVLESALRKNPKNYFALFEKGLAQYYLQNYEGAMKSWVSYIEDQKWGNVSESGWESMNQACENLSLIFTHLANDCQKKNDSLGLALNLKIANALNESREKLELYDEAKAKLSKDERMMLEIDMPFMKTVYIFQGRQAIDQKKMEKAVNYFDKVLDLDPTSTTAYFGRAYAKHALGKFKEAGRDLANGIKFKILSTNEFEIVRELFAIRYGGGLNLVFFDRVFEQYETFFSQFLQGQSINKDSLPILKVKGGAIINSIKDSNDYKSIAKIYDVLVNENGFYYAGQKTTMNIKFPVDLRDSFLFSLWEALFFHDVNQFQNG